MAIFLQDLDQRFPIVDENGKPTDYFMRLLRGQTGDLADGLTDADTAIAALQTDVATLEGRNIDTGFGLSGGGDLSADRTIALGNPALTDPAADRILFWDDSAGQMQWLTAGTNLTITGTTIDASGGGGGRTLISQLTSPTSGTFDFSSLSFTGYNRIEIELDDIAFSTIGRPGINFKIGGTVTTNQVYGFSRTGASSASAETEATSAAASIGLLDGTSNNWWVVTTGTAANAAYNGLVSILNPNSAKWKSFVFTGNTPQGNSGVQSWCEGGGVIRDAGTLDGLQIISSNGTISAGTVKIWGVS